MQNYIQCVHCIVLTHSKSIYLAMYLLSSLSIYLSIDLLFHYPSIYLYISSSPKKKLHHTISQFYNITYNPWFHPKNGNMWPTFSLPVQWGGGELRQQMQRHIGPGPAGWFRRFAAVRGPGNHPNKYSKRMDFTWLTIKDGGLTIQIEDPAQKKSVSSCKDWGLSSKNTWFIL